jgi:hypothetical protein
MASKSELKSISRLRKTFETGREAIEKLVVLARQMPPENQSGDWGKWSYSTGMGRGMLYTKFGRDGLAAVELGCGGDDDNNDIAHARFFQATAEWTQKRQFSADFTKEYAYCLAAFLGGKWWQNPAGGTDEFVSRIFFGFQETQPEILRLEELGSQSKGWFSAGTLELNPQNLVEFDNVRVCQTLNLTGLTELLRQNMEHGNYSVNSLTSIFTYPRTR